VDRALATVAGVMAGDTTVTAAEVVPEGAGAALRLTPPPGAGPAAWMRLGADAHRLRAALAAEGVASTVLPQGDGLLVALATA
jgi:coenzyme F420-0:L-glutamate ligase/coenzyme F420-1:gamma-L-glutamate ligase